MSRTDSGKPTVMIILGVTGDLAAKKILPALYNLYLKHLLPEKFRILGFGRKPFEDSSFRSYVEEILRKKNSSLDPKMLADFLERCRYQQGLFETDDSYKTLGINLDAMDAEWGTKANRLFYLSVPPSIYQVIFENLKSSGLSDALKDQEAETRILVEKPFGEDFRTAEKLDELLGTLFTEDKIYRIDHYLAKEMLQNVLAFRFYNDFFERLLNKDFVESLDITLWETLGVEQRGSFYDSIGTLRDVGQNHLLQMLALMTMDYPLEIESTPIHVRRSQLLSKLKVPTESEIVESSFRAQYEGYRSIQGVVPDSNTETYFKFKVEIDNDRWRGVPIMMESGKRMHEVMKRIVVNFKHPKECNCPPGIHYRNRLIISIEPYEGIIIEFWSKKPGHSMTLEKRTIDFLLREKEGKTQYVEEYEKLLLDCIAGDQSLFISTGEVRSMWMVIDPIIAAWKKGLIPLVTYQPDTDEAIRKSNMHSTVGLPS